MHPCGPAMLGVTHTVPWDTLASGFFRTGASTLVVRGCSGADGRGQRDPADYVAATQVPWCSLKGCACGPPVAGGTPTTSAYCLHLSNHCLGPPLLTRG